MQSHELLLCQPGIGLEDDWVPVFENSFPAEEKVPVERLRSDFARGIRHMYRTLNVGGELLCFSITRVFNQFTWLSYLATNPARRSTGIGSLHLKKLIEVAGGNYSSDFLFFDMESPTVRGLDRAMVRMRERRLRFYLKLGASVLPGRLRYVMPNFIAGQPPIPARLAWFELKGRSATSADFQNVITQVYQNIYGLASDDRLLQRMLAKF